jgi:hypothetical protein
LRELAQRRQRLRGLLMKESNLVGWSDLKLLKSLRLKVRRFEKLMFEMMNCEVEEGLKSEDSIFEAEHR